MSTCPEASLSVLVLPSGSAGDGLGEVLDDWYRAGLLRAAIWIRPEDVHVGEGRAPDVRGVLRQGSTETEGDLFALLGTQRLSLVRVVVVQLLKQPDTYDETQLSRAMDVQHWVRESVPGPRIAADGTEVEGTEVRTVNLVTGVTGLAEMPSAILPRGWDVAAVTSPEDRPDPGRANAFVRAESNLHGVAVLSTAVVANLIPGTVAGPFDDIEGDASVVLGKAMVIRSTARALVGDTIVEDLAGTARSRALTPQSMAVIDPHRFTVGDRDQLVEDLVVWLDQVDEGALAPSKADGAVRTQRSVMTVKTGIGVLIRFAGSALKVMVSALWRLLIRQTEGAATRAIVGEESGVELVLIPGVGEGLADDLGQIEMEDIRLRREALVAAERRPARLATHELWGALRDVGHGIVDGGALPEGAPRRLDGSRPVLLRDVGDVAPSPQDRFVVDGSAEPAIGAVAVPACSPVEARDGERRITQAVVEAQRMVSEAWREVEEASVSAEDAEARETSILAAKSQLATAEAQLRAVTKVDEAFREWLERRRGSLFWKFRERNADRLAYAAQSEVQMRESATQPSGLAADALGKLRRRYLWQSWAAVIIALCVGIWMVSTADTRGSHLLNELGTVVGCVLVALVVLIVVWYKGVLALLHKYEQAAEKRATAAAEFERQHQDRRRFEDVERGAELWCDVVGWSLHSPWLDGKREAGATDVREILVSLPAAVQLGEPALDERDVAQACRAAAAEVTTAGWRTRAYDRLVALFSDIPADASEVEAIAAVERLDTPQGREDLRQFRDELAGENLRRQAGEVVIDEIEGFLRRERLALAALSVRPVGDTSGVEHFEKDTDFLARALVPASPFAQETWSEQAKVQGVHQEMVSRAWARETPAAVSARGIVVKPVDEDDLERSRLIDVVVRSDVSAWLDMNKLRLFGRAPTESADAWKTSPGDSVFS